MKRSFRVKTLNLILLFPKKNPHLLISVLDYVDDKSFVRGFGLYTHDDGAFGCGFVNLRLVQSRREYRLAFRDNLDFHCFRGLKLFNFSPQKFYFYSSLKPLEIFRRRCILYFSKKSNIFYRLARVSFIFRGDFKFIDLRFAQFPIDRDLAVHSEFEDIWQVWSLVDDFPVGTGVLVDCSDGKHLVTVF